MSASWKSLHFPVSSNTDQPPLFISATFASNAYSIQLTDFTYLWTESLDRKAIVKRSFSEDTAIDPSEDAEQMRVFLQKIEAGIQGDEGTEMTLNYDSKNNTSNASCLKLLITANLPKPLPPLKWPIFLLQSAPSSFTEKITIPLLAAQNARIKETKCLIEVLKNKDHVIKKLVDKLEASGIDLGQIFPAIATKGGRKPTRALAEEKVKGLEVFDKARWKKDMKKNSSVGDLEQLAGMAFSADGNFEISHSEEYSIPKSWNVWWENLGGSSGTKLTTGPKEVRSTTKPLSAETNDIQIEPKEDGGDDFQVQSTLPAQIQNNKRSSVTLDDSTEDEDDDLGTTSQHSVIPDSFSSHAPPKPTAETSKLGAIGRRPKPTVEPSPMPTVDTYMNDETSEGEGRNAPSPPPPSLPQPIATTSVKPKIGGLGRIGGRKKEVTPPPLSSPAQMELDSNEKKTPYKLGVIGHKAQHNSTASSVEPATRAISPIAHKKDESPPRETSEERTLRKREEIQRDLIEKTKKPVKKKRKF